MKKVLIIIDEYRPDNNANSTCIENIIDELSSIYDVTVFTSKINKTYIEDEESIEFIKRYPNKYLKLYKRYSEGVMNSLSKVIFRVFNTIFVNFFWADINYLWYISQKKQMLRDVQNNNYDFIVSASGSFAVQQIGIYLSNKTGISWFAYFNDPLPDKNHLFGTRKNYGMNIYKQSRKVFERAEGIIFNKHLYQSYIKEKSYSQYSNKIHEIDYPLVRPLGIMNTKPQNKFIIVYAGALYRSIRNPQNILPILVDLSKSIDIEVHFLGGGDCSDILKEYEYNYEWFSYHGQLKIDEARSYIYSANMLINIGNKIENQTPSKIFEYISTGKLICNFYFKEYDTSMHYLEKYKNSINIKVGSMDSRAAGDRIIDFIKNNEEILNIEEIKNSFIENTPTYAMEKFLTLFRS